MCVCARVSFVYLCVCVWCVCVWGEYVGILGGIGSVSRSGVCVCVCVCVIVVKIVCIW